MTASNRPSQATLEADRAATLALQDLPDYAPRNPHYGVDTLNRLEAELSAAEQAELRARRAYERAREQANVAAHALHNAVLGARAEVIVQYGPDSSAVTLVGLKRKSEHKRPARRRATAEA